LIINDHEKWMKIALQEAIKAYNSNEVPIGSIIILNNEIIGKGYNQCETLKDPTAHAEIISITAACSTINDWRLNNSIIYVTKEPCAMCAGAIINSRIKQVVFGFYDEKEGCCGSTYQLCGDKRFKHQTFVRGGILEQESLDLVQDFFKKHRK
tara:strand:- start:67 stop:525 length:459 start_codon:yes stop_codon:yes gene_type:complete